MNNLNNIFYPKSICIAGASGKEKSIGYELLRSIVEYGFKGKIYPVNPKAENILNISCFKSITDIKEKIDLAIIAVPKQYVIQSIDELIQKEVKSIILITAGFRETGEEGKKLEEKILDKVKEHNIRMIGPNCMGVINTLNSIKLNATFVAEKPEKGGIGFLSQSGALGAAVLNSLRETNIRFAHFISVGNKADVNENDLLNFWLNDKNIKTITMYLESFEDGLEFINIYKNSENKKPLIVLKAGKTQSGMKAASSHTGALSSNERIIDSLLKQFGIIRSSNLNEMFNTAKGFEQFPLPKGNRVAIVTNAGGPAILAVDALEQKGLKLSQLTKGTLTKLREIVHPQGSINNPIDLLPGGTSENYKSVCEVLLNDESVDSIISIFVEPVMVNAFSVIESINSIESFKPIYQVCMPLPEFWDHYLKHSKYKKPIFKNPEDPSEIISNILHYEKKKYLSFSIDTERLTGQSNEIFLSQSKVETISKKYNIPIVEQKIIKIDELKNLTSLKYPLVIKGINEQVVHKSELDAVKLDIKDFQELKTAIHEINESFKKNELNLEEILVQKYIRTKHELLIGGYRDASFGPVIMFGSGGKYVELINDVQVRSAYINDAEIYEMINMTSIGKIIQGVRGEKGIHLDKIKQIILSVSKILVEHKNILEIDLNPIIISSDEEIFAVDIRIKIGK